MYSVHNLKNKNKINIKELIKKYNFKYEIKKVEKIESFESELINNFDENSYSELIKLKSQLNRD